MKILVIQSRSRKEMLDAEQAEYRRSIGDAADVMFESALDSTRSWDKPDEMLSRFDGVIIAGSGEYDLHGGRSEDDPARMTARDVVARLRSFVAHLLAHNIPVLGVCFGHQIIAEIQGGNVTNDHAQKKVGSYEVSLTDTGATDPLFAALPRSFIAQYGHKDSVTTLPIGAELLASSSLCKFSALRYGQNVYTVQFHPELTAQDVHWKLANSPGYLPEGVDVESLVKPSPEASRIIPLFIEKIARSAK